MFYGFREEYPDVKNLIKVEFYSENKKDLQLIGQYTILQFEDASLKESFIKNRKKVINILEAFVQEELNNPNSYLNNEEVNSQDANVFNVLFELLENNEVNIQSFGYEIPAVKHPLRIIY